MSKQQGDWVKSEVRGSEFGDQRLDCRFEKMLSDMSRNIGNSMAVACQDWASTKAAYRFISNERVSEQEILAGHFESTRERFRATDGPVLVLHDTTEFSFKRQDPAAIGVLKKLPVQTVFGCRVFSCGILMHSSLVVTTGGLPLGLGAVKFWTRDRFKGTDALKRKINPTRVPIGKKESVRWLENLSQSTALLAEPKRCVHIGDRESDIYELFSLAQEQQTHFLFRTCNDRMAGNGKTLVSKILAEQPVKGTYSLRVRNKLGEQRQAKLEIKFTSLTVHPPEYKKRAFPALILTVIEARERLKPKKGDRIEWKLITNLPVCSLTSAIEKLRWYSMRWKIETFHKILKSGCRAEESRLRTAERLVNLIAMFCILSWRVFWITTLRREAPRAKASAAFTKSEIDILGRLHRKKQKNSSLQISILQVAKLGGYLARATDPPPGNIVIWRGLSRLSDIQIGFSLAADTCG
jgi:hypothetical protein